MPDRLAGLRAVPGSTPHVPDREVGASQDIIVADRPRHADCRLGIRHRPFQVPLPHGGPGHPGQRFGLADAIAELARDLAALLGFGEGTVEFADHEVEGRLRPVNFDDRVPVRQPVQVPGRLERLVVEGEGLTNRESLAGFPGGHQEVLERLWPLLGLRVVASENLTVLVEPLSMECLEGLADGPVKFRPPVGLERLVGDLLCQTR